MKYIFVSLGLSLLMTALCLYSSFCITQAVQETTYLLEAAVEAEKAGNKEDAVRIVHEAAQSWKSHEIFFGTVLRHDEIDSVIEEFARLESYASTQDQDDFLSNCHALIARLEHIKEMERPTFQNIM